MSFDWKEVSFSDVIQINPSYPLRKKEVAPKVSMADLEPFTRKVVKFEMVEYTGGSKFKNGDTLLARITPCLENGKTAYVNILKKDEVGFGSTEFIVLREKEGVTDDKFVYYLAISPEFRNIAIKSMTGTSGRQRAQVDVISKWKFKLPPINEQVEIGHLLSTLDDKIELNNAINKTLEEMSQALFKRWFVEFEFPNENGEPYKSSGGEFEESELGLIPKGWKISSLDDIAEYLNGLAMQKYRPTGDDFIPVIKIKELNQGRTSADSDKARPDLDEKYIVQDGDILFSWSGTLLVKLWCGGIGGLNQHLFKVTSNKYEKWFYYYWTLHHLEKFKNIASSKATTMGHIKRNDLKEAKVVIPEPSVYQKATELFQPLIDKIVQLNVESRNLGVIRDILLPKLMSGEIRVPVEQND